MYPRYVLNYIAKEFKKFLKLFFKFNFYFIL